MISMNSTLGQKRKAMQLEKESLEFGVFGAHGWKRTQCHPGECATYPSTVPGWKGQVSRGLPSYPLPLSEGCCWRPGASVLTTSQQALGLTALGNSFQRQYKPNTTRSHGMPSGTKMRPGH